ncbi:MAG: geranylgeranylglyceryl/heptaprenylglyceryl phosphate synthase [Brumimicrobium sp.]|nr:geranylgeranylglyceryl/heptaprenylglyceryl phosphate synthase [Brumimicrobium sp.]MCO5269654.1 geranylgeranylglyceryl/heptaprenylglyceryl phosphate synthase [Brumimicrobium sp.]
MKLTDKIYTKFRSAVGQIAVLIDPEKTNTLEVLTPIIQKAEFAKIDYFFIGGSSVSKEDFQSTIHLLRSLTSIPIIIFPGDHQQISKEADALLYLSLLSGRNPEYLIGQHVKSAQEVLALPLEIIPTAYILIDGGVYSSTSYISQTTPIPHDNETIALNTAIAGTLQGKKVVYFDAGSGAKHTINPHLIQKLKSELDTVVIVGGGIRDVAHIESFTKAGANIVVIGNRIEEDIDFLLDIHHFTEKRS